MLAVIYLFYKSYIYFMKVLKTVFIMIGAVIGAGTILTKDVEPYSIVVGNPGRKIKSRFNTETIELLEQSKWFDLGPTDLLKFYSWINSPNEFALRIINENKSR